MKYIKNVDTIEHTWLGQEVGGDTYYQIQDVEEKAWSSNSALLADIASGVAVVAKSDDGLCDITDISAAIDYLKNIPESAVVDYDGAPLSRVKVTISGWSYQLHGTEFTTSKIGSVHSKKHDGTDIGFTTIKLYDVNGAEITDPVNESQCVKTIIDWEPTHDYEIVGGVFKVKEALTSDIRMWVVGVPDVPEIYGGSKVFVSNINLRYIGLEEGVVADGRASKYLQYNSQVHTNKIRMIYKHDAGIQVDMHIIFEIFKA